MKPRDGLDVVEDKDVITMLEANVFHTEVRTVARVEPGAAYMHVAPAFYMKKRGYWPRPPLPCSSPTAMSVADVPHTTCSPLSHDTLWYA